MFKQLLIIATIVTSTATYAWGAREQGALAGLVIGGVVMSGANDHRQPTYRGYQYPDHRVCGYNVICQPQPTYHVNQPYCFDTFVYDRVGNIVGTRKVCQ